jgi:hypothetical protein
MNKSFRISFSYLLLILILVSCRKDRNESADTIYNQWEVVDIMSVESVTYAKKDNFNPLIQFYSNGSVSLKLDANNCIGDFKLTGYGKIEITLKGCTEICCDSDFSKKIQETLSQVTSYKMDNNKMKLNVTGWGWINLKLHN